MIKVKRKIHFARRSHGRRVILDVTPVADVPLGCLPRVARLMALAIHCDRLIREGRITDQSELARLCHVTQPRMTQVMNLNHLAPDIQEELLLQPRITSGRDPIHEKMLRPIAAEANWTRQRQLWSFRRRSLA